MCPALTGCTSQKLAGAAQAGVAATANTSVPEWLRAPKLFNVNRTTVNTTTIKRTTTVLLETECPEQWPGTPSLRPEVWPGLPSPQQVGQDGKNMWAGTSSPQKYARQYVEQT